MTIVYENVPSAAIPFILAHVRDCGATVVFESESSGVVYGPPGELHFSHDGSTLTVSVVKNAGHFPKALLIGGIKQTIEEALERTRRESAEQFHRHGVQLQNL